MKDDKRDDIRQYEAEMKGYWYNRPDGLARYLFENSSLSKKYVYMYADCQDGEKGDKILTTRFTLRLPQDKDRKQLFSSNTIDEISKWLERCKEAGQDHQFALRWYLSDGQRFEWKMSENFTEIKAYPLDGCNDIQKWVEGVYEKVLNCVTIGFPTMTTYSWTILDPTKILQKMQKPLSEDLQEIQEPSPPASPATWEDLSDDNNDGIYYFYGLLQNQSPHKDIETIVVSAKEEVPGVFWKLKAEWKKMNHKRKIPVYAGKAYVGACCRCGEPVFAGTGAVQ